MPIVPAGSKVNFITGWTADGNSQVDFGKNVWVAQSFSLAALYRLFRCPFKFWDTEAGHIKYFALRHALPDGTPTGANIVESHKAAQQDSAASPGRWLLIDFDSFPDLPAGNYALLAYVPDAAWTASQHISAQATPRLYTDGKAFRSTDSGTTWSEIPNTNLLFQIWGYQEPPAPPPPSEIGNWYQTNLTYFLTLTGYRIVTTTNRPVHQFLRWTITPPQKHVKPVIVRGAVAGTYIDQCFVVYYDIEQAEPGDTFFHTFIVEPWPHCQTRYFYFWATKLAELMPSASPIYEKHRYSPAVPITVNIYSDPTRGLTTVDGSAYRYGSNLTWPNIHDGAGNLREYSDPSHYVWLSAGNIANRWAQLVRHKATFSLASIPLGSTILAVSFFFWVVGKNAGFVTPPSYALYTPTTPPWNDVINADYQGIGTTPISTILTYANIINGAFNHVDILPASLPLFVPGQLAKIAMREVNCDAANIPPPWISGRSMFMGFYSRDFATAAKRPYLQVTYLPP